MLSLAACLLVITSPLVSALRIGTWNMRYDSQSNDITVQESIDSLADPLQHFTDLGISNGAEQPWSTRRIRVAEHVLNEGASILSVQEALVRQVNDLVELLGDEWSYVGVGRDDGAVAGEFSAIFYKTTDVTLSWNDTFWLSNTPLEPSKYPGAGSYRIANVARFTAGCKTFTLINTHLDDISDDQRQLGASMILTRAKYEAVQSNGPVFVTGDFNSPSTGDDSAAYGIITGSHDPFAMNATWAAKYDVCDKMSDFVMEDLRGQAPRRMVSKNYATYSAWTGPSDTSKWTRIDFVFGGSNGGWAANSYKVDSALNDDGLLMSDHRPTFVDISF
ncbi:Endonuclease/exonuclease/phosphatase [Armillaria nabsnona]|nr:Endonuclease/exonuclease/phosphatase [Armillaria nabsnona]